VASSAGLAVSVAWQIGPDAAYCVDGQVYAAGAALSWLARWGLLARAEDLDAVVESVPDDGGVTVVPALSGLGAPWWQPDALAAIEGIGPGTQPAHVVRATVEGLAAQVALLARAVAVDLGRPLAHLAVDGGLTRSRTLMQAQADLLGVPVEVAASPHATAAGVGALARLGAGSGTTLHDVVPPVDREARYEPIMAADEAEDRLARFERAVSRRVDAAGGSSS
jgi:glycerol kinase